MNLRASILLALAIATCIAASIHFHGASRFDPTATKPEPKENIAWPTNEPPMNIEPIAEKVPPEIPAFSNQMPAIPKSPLPDDRREIAKSEPPTESVRNKSVHRNPYWERMQQDFNRHLDLLENEGNAGKRRQLIELLARYVRIDTMQVLDWAMSLTDPEEKRLALETINKYAISGIGAQIQTDPENGLPRIANTTVLGAVATTGKIDIGDHIAGIVNSDGSITYFNDMPRSKIVQILRGKPGSEVELVMQRMNGADEEPFVFTVPIQRSLLVMEPPVD